jgi:hypothetical protein
MPGNRGARHEGFKEYPRGVWYGSQGPQRDVIGHRLADHRSHPALFFGRGRLMASRGPKPVDEMIAGRRTIARPQRSRGQRREDRTPEEPELPMLPADCPIVPLGVRGQKFFFLDELGQLIELAADKVAAKGILAMLGRKNYLAETWWPRFGAPDKETGLPKVTGWRPEQAALLLTCAASHEGVFDPVGKVRGRGAHLGANGELILHCGSKIYIGSAPGEPEPERPWCDAGIVVDGKVYPRGAEVPKPAAGVYDKQLPMHIFRMLGSWHWARPIDPVLLLGWIASAVYGGALRWRPHLWVTGDSAAGKSTLQELLERVLGLWLLQSTDATEAGIRQILGYDTLPVALDEIEAEEDNRRANAIIKLARTGSSGGKGVRGGQDHQGHEFTSRSCFLFSSILMPPLLDQDRNRLAILELLELPKGAKPPVLDPREMAQAGQAILRRLVDGWPRFGSTLNEMRAALAKVGHNGRTADQFGTLLAGAYLLMEEDDLELEATALDWAAQLDARSLAEKAGQLSNALRCAGHLASSNLPPIGGETPASIASWCLDQLNGDEDRWKRVKLRLGAHGMRVVRAVQEAPGPDDDARAVKYKIGDPGGFQTPAAELYLAVACSSRGLDPLWRDSQWQGRAGAAGGWSQALGRIGGAIKGQKVRIGGEKPAVVLVPLGAIADLEDARGVAK